MAAALAGSSAALVLCAVLLLIYSRARLSARRIRVARRKENYADTVPRRHD